MERYLYGRLARWQSAICKGLKGGTLSDQAVRGLRPGSFREQIKYLHNLLKKVLLVHVERVEHNLHCLSNNAVNVSDTADFSGCYSRMCRG
jgi:hypothetical protein